MVNYKFEPQDIYNRYKRGIHPSPGKTVTKRGSKQVSGIDSHERRTLVYMHVNAIGVVFLQCLFFIGKKISLLF